MLAERSGGRCKPEQCKTESTLEAVCENSTGGTVITFKVSVNNTNQGGNAGKTSRPYIGARGFYNSNLKSGRLNK